VCDCSRGDSLSGDGRFRPSKPSPARQLDRVATTLTGKRPGRNLPEMMLVRGMTSSEEGRGRNRFRRCRAMEEPRSATALRLRPEDVYRRANWTRVAPTPKLQRRNSNGRGSSRRCCWTATRARQGLHSVAASIAPSHDGRASRVARSAPASACEGNALPEFGPHTPSSAARRTGRARSAAEI
jgi:hypothetical protein